MITLKQNTEKKLNNYVSAFDGNYDKMINSILSYRITQLKKSIISFQTDLSFFEKKYEMETEVFYEKFENGELSDENNDFYQWSGEYEALMDYQKELNCLL